MRYPAPILLIAVLCVGCFTTKGSESGGETADTAAGPPDAVLTGLASAEENLIGIEPGELTGDAEPDILVAIHAENEAYVGWAVLSVVPGPFVGSVDVSRLSTLTLGGAVDEQITAFAVGDATNDGSADLVFNLDGVSILTGPLSERSKLSGPDIFIPWSGPVSPVALEEFDLGADFTGDGVADMAVAAPNSGGQGKTDAEADVYMFDGPLSDRAFADAVAILTDVGGPSGPGPILSVDADVTGDGYDDLVTCRRDVDDELLVVPGPLTGILSLDDPPVSRGRFRCNGVSPIGDVDGNGFTDLLTVAESECSEVMLFLGPLPAAFAPGDSSWSASWPDCSPGYYGGEGQIEALSPAGDQDGDGLDDIVLGGDFTGLFLGPFAFSHFYGEADVQFEPRGFVRTGDLLGDAAPDVAVASPEDDTVSIWEGGHFTRRP